MEQTKLEATILQVGTTREEWSVEAIDMPEGDCYVTLFSGPFARERAQEYARSKYAVVRDQ